MKAYKVTGYGSITLKEGITISVIQISHFTKYRIYYINGRFENIITTDYVYPHHWFRNKQQAIEFAKQKIKEKIEYHKNKLKRFKEQLKLLKGINMK